MPRNWDHFLSTHLALLKTKPKPPSSFCKPRYDPHTYPGHSQFTYNHVQNIHIKPTMYSGHTILFSKFSNWVLKTLHLPPSTTQNLLTTQIHQTIQSMYSWPPQYTTAMQIINYNTYIHISHGVISKHDNEEATTANLTSQRNFRGKIEMKKRNKISLSVLLKLIFLIDSTFCNLFFYILYNTYIYLHLHSHSHSHISFYYSHLKSLNVSNAFLGSLTLRKPYKS